MVTATCMRHTSYADNDLRQHCYGVQICSLDTRMDEIVIALVVNKVIVLVLWRIESDQQVNCWI